MKRIILTALIVMCAAFASENVEAKHSDCKHTTVKQQQITVQCYATTKAGTRCKRMTSNLGGYCSVHQ